MVLSIVIPTLDAASHLGTCIAALAAGERKARVLGIMVPEIEIVVVDGGSADDTVQVASNLGLRVVTAPRGRGHQLAEGARSSNGQWLMFLHADTCLAEDWLIAATGFINNPANAARAAAYRFALDDGARAARVIERLVALRCRLFALPYGDQGLLISRGFYDALGGFRREPLMEDVDLVCRIGSHRLRLFEIAAVTSAARYRRGGWLLRPARNLSCLGLYFLGVPPAAIARIYGR